ncbi:glutamate-5-semialdehyde dehydrogenase [Halotalea alkalilenta]|uniref:glutamate-5-semialdehyde dehydrogenase n=1 Tax=Halotalea alkalilenta TaxID=376489 RepID=UPI0006934CA7|nr:glutamate-5-semialdehyde dehydrogenase [Halotalea alkalilenta]
MSHHLESSSSQASIELVRYMQALGARARTAASVLALADSRRKNAALAHIGERLEAGREALKAANREDLELAGERGLASALLDRLELTDARIDAMIQGLATVASLDDPVGAIDGLKRRPNGLRIGKMRVPIGVIGIIYESRPNVTVDAAALCLKSGNACILRGGSEASRSNALIGECVSLGIEDAGLPREAVQVVGTSDRAAVGELVRMRESIDLIIPRGGRSLIERVSEEARIPVLKHLDGNCHVFVDASAELERALEIAFNAKTYRYGICGAMETLLVDAPIAEAFLPRIAARLIDHGVELRGCARARALVPSMLAASDEDWYTEYLGPTLAVRVVDGVEAAIEHINHYGSHHTDAIVTEHLARSERFLAAVDSSSVMVNAPTCFADGAEYGLGAEIGISTDKLHARGPVGLEGLTTQKYVVLGEGQLRG